MKSAKNHSNSLIYTPLFFLSCIFLITIILSSGCKDKNEQLLEPEETNGFNETLVRYATYIHSSIPVSSANQYQLTQNNRSQVYWYNIAPSDVKVTDIMGEDFVVKQQYALVNTMDVVFNPDKNGIYNTGQLSADPKENWGGLFRSVPLNIIDRNSSKNLMMKIWIKIIETSPEAVLNIDLGEISEDIIPNLKLDTEDKNNNDVLDEGEDVGLDMLASQLEPGYDQNLNADPYHDDFSFFLGNMGNNDYSHINSPEGNGQAIDLGRVPDSEDLSRNFTLDKNNNYNSYQIPLEKNKLTSVRIIEYGHNGWLRVKIPIDLPGRTIGNFNITQLETIRLWITGAAKKVHIRIAEIKFEEF